MENLLSYIGLLLVGTAFYKYETKIIDITQYEIINPKIPREFNNFKIVNISDLHNKSFGKNNKRLLDKIDNLKPDIVVITGDLVD
ncbi:MAG TPA: metallophosphoesterase, partial [Peptostreptococcaceae bacterium]|nr:metallophosphoesterase [Peptostreptococcaceae bacterium]